MKRADFFLFPFIMDFVMAMMLLMVNLTAQDLGATPFQLGLIGLAWGVPFAVFSPVTGKLVGRFNRRTLLLTGSFLNALCVAGCGFATAPQHLMMVSPLGGLGAAIFWPTFETYLHTQDSAETHRRMGTFNMGWTLGLLSGYAVAGYYYSLVGGRLGFWSISAVIFLSTVYLAWQTRKDSPVDRSEEKPAHAARSQPLRRKGYLRMAWVANFSLYFASAAASTIFPKLARSLGITDGSIGVLLAIVMGAQAASSALLVKSGRWHYRLAPLLVMQGVGIAGMLAVAFGYSPLIFAVGLGMVGFARGLTYAASLYYGLDDGEAHGTNLGIHEAIVGISFVVAPYLSGWAADQYSLRTPFELSAGVIFLSLLIEMAMWKSLPEMVLETS